MKDIILLNTELIINLVSNNIKKIDIFCVVSKIVSINMLSERLKMNEQLSFTYETDRFLNDIVGNKILKNPIIALVELVANAWDAGATRVDIEWPSLDNQRFSIVDNGHGMSDEEFKERWLRYSYDRSKNQGLVVEVIHKGEKYKRVVFGKNGKGRHASFCFNFSYQVETKKQGSSSSNRYKVIKTSGDKPIDVKQIDPQNIIVNNGTGIFVENSQNLDIPEKTIIDELGTRFLFDPTFEVYVNNHKVSFRDINQNKVDTINIKDEDIEILVIKTGQSDITSKLHGIAWQVNGRLVGDFSWNEDLDIDKRTKEAKSLGFIVKAKTDEKDNYMKNFVLPDWSGFVSDGMAELQGLVNKEISNYINKQNVVLVKETVNSLASQRKNNLLQIGTINTYKWKRTLHEIITQCPSLSEKHLEKVSDILLKMEKAESKYRLVELLSQMSSNDYDNLSKILEKWGIEATKLILDELEFRIKLINELEKKINRDDTDEVHELQPLFDRGLWIFGPEFESIEYTSNKAIATVIKKFMKCPEVRGVSKNRPDFVVLPDGNCSNFYSRPSYDDNNEENGIERLVIIELKKPTVSIDTDEKNQPWKYYKELKNKGLITSNTQKTVAYVLGKTIAIGEEGEKTEANGALVIKPMTYNVIISRAKARLFKLYDKVKKSVAFLNDDQASFLDVI